MSTETTTTDRYYERQKYGTANFTLEQFRLLSEGLAMLRLYQQGFIDVDGRAKLTAIKKLENRVNRWREKLGETERW